MTSSLQSSTDPFSPIKSIKDVKIGAITNVQKLLTIGDPQHSLLAPDANREGSKGISKRFKTLGNPNMALQL